MSACVEPLLDVRNVIVDYAGRGWRAQKFRALDDVSISVGPARTVGVVGESGSGKSTLGRAILGLVGVADGSIRFKEHDLLALSRKQRRALSADLQVVFQDPYGSLNPAMSVGEILSEPLAVQNVSREAARKRVRTVLDQVGLPKDASERRPREFSGGQRQRVAIARALTLRPSVIICDEPVSALDLSTQARVLDLLLQIQMETGVSFVFISHDLDVVKHLSHEVVVMRKGRIVESGPTSVVTEKPSEVYTQQLLLSAPVPDLGVQRQRRERRLGL